ncbi:MAG: hypothetical protein FJZ92_13485, partial [Chloroflexi bacterium]|nr:hypothetical protein [Chloroflexota bacterium]
METVPVTVNAFVTDTEFVENVMVPAPATPPPVTVTVTTPPIGSVPVHDWFVHVRPATFVSTPRFVDAVTVPPGIGARPFASTHVALMLPDAAVNPIETVPAVTVAEA